VNEGIKALVRVLPGSWALVFTNRSKHSRCNPVRKSGRFLRNSGGSSRLVSAIPKSVASTLWHAGQRDLYAYWGYLPAGHRSDSPQDVAIPPRRPCRALFPKITGNTTSPSERVRRLDFRRDREGAEQRDAGHQARQGRDDSPARADEAPGSRAGYDSAPGAEFAARPEVPLSCN
jgi:hypothetical protein